MKKTTLIIGIIIFSLLFITFITFTIERKTIPPSDLFEEIEEEQKQEKPQRVVIKEVVSGDNK